MSQPEGAGSNGLQRIPVDDATINVETFGRRSDQAIVLLGGVMAAMDCWDDEFCRRLAGAGRFVIRYDHRDTGGSSQYPPDEPSYGFNELVSDALGVLDGLGVRQAHLVGLSMGGGIAQRLAIEAPDRVLSLTLMSSSPGLRPAAAPDPDLPRMSAEIEAQFTDPDQRPRHNHMVIESGPSYRDQLGAITVPTLVIHGVEDPLFPFGHAQALAGEIKGARLIPLDGVGHGLAPERFWPTIIPAIVEQTGEV